MHEMRQHFTVKLLISLLIVPLTPSPLLSLCAGAELTVVHCSVVQCSVVHCSVVVVVFVVCCSPKNSDTYTQTANKINNRKKWNV